MPIRAAADADLIVTGHLEELRLRHCSPATFERTRVELSRLLQHLREIGVMDLHAIGQAELFAYARALESWPSRRGGQLSLSTRSSAVSIVRRFFASLAKRGHIPRDPAATLPLPRVSRLPRCLLTRGQARRLMTAPSPATALGQRDRTLLELLYGTGLRASEARQADVHDYDALRRALLVRNGKGRKDRLVPMTGRAAAALARYLSHARPALARRGSPALFPSRHGRRLSASALQLLVRRHGRAIGVQLHPHALRHACATHLLQGGASIRHIQELLGHRRLSTTALYAQVTICDLRAALARYHPRMPPAGRQKTPTMSRALRMPWPTADRPWRRRD